MKNILLYTCMSFIAFVSNAQINKGSTFLGGDLQYRKVETKYESPTSNITYTSKSYEFLPVFGKAIKQDLILGGFAGIAVADENQMNGYSEYDSYEGGLFIRKYKNLGNGGFYLFLEGKLGANYVESEVYNTNYSSSKKMSYYLSLYPGISYALSRKFHLETGLANLLSVGYSHEYRSMNYRTRQDYFYFNSSIDNGSAFYLGFRVLIGK